MQVIQKISLYEELISLPDLLTGEILNGQLYAHPRPSGKHILVASNIGAEFHGPYQRGKDGPGGWWILQEPEVHFTLDTEVAVPDIAGWRKERMPEIPDSHKFTTAPDWICEVLSPSTESIDRQIKMPLYARFGVKYLWLVHPKKRTLEAYQLTNGNWEEQGKFLSNDTVCIEPFDSIKISVSDLLG